MTYELDSSFVVCAYSDVDKTSGCGLRCSLRNEVVAVDDACFSFLSEDAVFSIPALPVLRQERSV